jgi:hypothetical protein
VGRDAFEAPLLALAAPTRRDVGKNEHEPPRLGKRVARDRCGNRPLALRRRIGGEPLGPVARIDDEPARLERHTPDTAAPAPAECRRTLPNPWLAAVCPRDRREHGERELGAAAETDVAREPLADLDLGPRHVE